MNTIQNNGGGFLRLVAAMIICTLATTQVAYSQSHNLGVLNHYYSDNVLADSVRVTCWINLPDCDSLSRGITSYDITEYSGKTERQIYVPESFGRMNNHLVDDLCFRYIPETYAKFLEYAVANNLKKSESYIITLMLFPKVQLNDASSLVVQDILSVCNRLCSKKWPRKWHLSFKPPKELAALREFAFRRIPEKVLTDNDSVYVVELQPNPVAYYRAQRVLVVFPSSEMIYEFREYDPETRVSVIPATPEESVLELIQLVKSGQSVPISEKISGLNTSGRSYNVLILGKRGGHFIPLSYEHSGVLFDPLPSEVRSSLEEKLGKEHYDSYNKDTLLLSVRDYRIIQSYDHCIKIEVTDKSKQSLINIVKYSVIDIEMMDDRIIAKGNDILSSSVPDGCEYFYAINHKGYIVSYENRITLLKVPKNQYWPVSQDDR